MRFRVACAQMNSAADMQFNIAQADAAIRQAASRGAELITTPENLFFMQAPGKELPAYDMHNHPGILHCQELARELKTWILLGSVALTAPHGRHHNRSLLLNGTGSVAAFYDKLHLFDVDLGKGEKYEESARIYPGAEAVLACTPWGKLGMSVCYDLRFPHLYRTLAKAGATLLAVPSAFTYATGQAHWHVLLRARAIENGCYVFAPAQCGAHPGGRRTYGHSLIIDPWGVIVAEASEENPEIIMADIDTDNIQAVRNSLPSLTHDREYVLKRGN